MGIVSFCPNGHRVKVKDHLAGRKGICPRCGSRFRIPSAAQPALAARTAAPVAVALMPAARIVSFDATLAAGLPPALALTAEPVAVEPSAPVEQVAAAQLQVAPVVEEQVAATVEQAIVPAAQAVTPAEEAWPVFEHGDVPATEVELVADHECSTYAAIEQDPQLPWYVAINGAGRWLAADAMRQWLDSGQASGDEQVCRGDWKSGKKIYEVFPEINPGAGW
jgi:hypothetical protein